MISITASILHRLNLIINPAHKRWLNYTKYRTSRDRAHKIRKELTTHKKYKVVDGKLKNEMMEYCREYLGSSLYWPWLAVYTELRGEFVKGWMPNDYYRFNLLPNVNPNKFMSLSEAKTLDHWIFRESAICPFFIRLNGKFYDGFGEFKSVAEVEQMLSEMDCEVVIKPDNGKGGEGVIFKKAKEINLDKLSLSSDYIVQPVIEQHDELKVINPSSVNTFRVFTFISPQGEVKVKFTMLRFGNGDSRVDNSSGGGGWVNIQSDGVMKNMSYDINGNKFGRIHPSTGVVYSKLSFPFVENVNRFCQNLHKNFPYNSIVGWDIAVDESENPILIEWNANNPGLWQIEALYGPFFKKEIEDNLFKEYN
jgi:hypothetical protein